MEKESFQVIELAPGCYFCGNRGMTGRLEWASIGSPVLARRVTLDTPILEEIRTVMPKARIVQINVSYDVVEIV